MRRVLLVAAVIAVALLRPASTAPRYPVILVATPASTPECWGLSAGGRVTPGGLYQRLMQAGYVPDVTLFVLEYPEGDDTDPRGGAMLLTGLVSRVLQATGAQHVNLVGYGAGGLAVCHYLQGYDDGGVDTAVLVSAPVQGSFLATYYRIQWEVVRQEAGARGSFPWLRAPAIPSTVQESPLQVFADHTSYVAARAHLVYAPLYGEYVLESRWLNLPGRQPFTASFEAWLARSRPEFFVEHLLDAKEAPPVWADPGETSRGFYELMALHSGRRLYLVERTGVSDLLLDMVADGYLPTSWQDALRHYGYRLVEALGRRILLGSRAGLMSTFLEKVGALAGFNPNGASLSQVLQISVPMAGVSRPDAATGLVLVPANLGLERWNQWRRDGGGPRLVVAGSRLPNLWQPLIPSAGPNDLAVEVEAMLPPPGPDDTFRIWSGTLGPNHLTMLKRRDVQDFILTELARPPLPVRTHRPLAARTPSKTWSWQESGRVRVSSWRPTYIRVTAQRLSGVKGELEVEFHLPDLPPGWDWLLHSGPVQKLTGPGRVQLALGVLEDETVVGVRPVPQAGINGVASELTRDIAYQVRFTAGTVEAELPPAPSYDREPVRVVLTTKRTTLRQESRTYHQRWVWDLGDGTLLEKDDPSLTSVALEHRYLQPGTYQVKATAYDNHGRVIRYLTWVQRVDQAPATATFFAESIVEPAVKVMVDGPQAWVTGRPAGFYVTVQVAEIPGVHREVVSIDPGPYFEVWWERPGRFTVQAAATVRLVYEFPERKVTVNNTYLGSTSLDVLAPVITD
ncbi:MAG: PKD domain-containing protein [Bacillota bacterium]